MNLFKRINISIKLFKQGFGQYKFQIIVLVVLGFLSSILEGLGINVLIPLLSFIINDGPVQGDVISNTIANIFSYFKIDFRLRNLLILINILFISKAIVLFLFNFIKIRISEGYAFNTRQKLFGKTLTSEWLHLLKQKLGHAENTIMFNIWYSSGLLKNISMLFITISGLLVYFLVALNINWEITLFTLALGLTLFLFYKPIAYKIKNLTQRMVKLNKNIAHFVNQNILGMKSVKVHNIQKQIADIGLKDFSNLNKLTVRRGLWNESVRISMDPISIIFISLVLLFFYNSSSFNFATIVALVYLIQKMFLYFKQLQVNILSITKAIPHLMMVLKYEKDIKDHQEKDIGFNKFSFNKLLEFKNVFFKYPHGQTVFSDISFSITKGAMVGLIGSSGSGKTTAVDLILRLLKPDKGNILIDGQDIENIKLNDWRNNIGYVSQDIFLINGSFKDNIKFYDDSITDKQLESSAKLANIYDFIVNNPDGFDTNVGERGMNLSVGQRQRVIIARVLAKNPKFLILDEATSSIDNESELAIQKAIDKIKNKMTIIVIAHRLSTIINCDNLIVLENGQIIEQGDPNKLLKNKNSCFNKVYNIRN